MPNYLARLRFLSVLFFALLALLASRLFFLQIVKHQDYSDKADRQYQRQVAPVADRGNIYFSTKDGQLVTAATMQEGFLLAVNPLRLVNPEKVYQQLNNIFPLDYTGFIAKATKANDPYEEIASQLNADSAAKIQALGIDGVSVYKTRWRVYPAGKLASHALGFMAYDGDQLTGRYGLEKQFNQQLLRPTDQTFVGFLANILSELKGVATGGTETSSPADVVLTIEPQVQQTLESELAAVRQYYQAELAGGIILDPQTGAIAAMAAWPDFDPGTKQSNINVLQNPLVETVREMGSIVKPLTMAAALDAGAVTATTTYLDQGFVELNGRRINNYDGRGRGVIPMQEVLNQSLNTGAVFAMQKLGVEQFRRYFLNYGLGEKTGVDLPNEIAGLVGPIRNSPEEVNYATAAFGQGISLTPIETARALAALGNGGKLVQPHVVKKLEYHDLTTTSTEMASVVQRQVLKPETSKEITRMLVQVVDKALAGGKVKQANYSIAAKTGTAQVPNPATHQYYDDVYLHSFFGYFPASQPRFLIFLYLYHPLGVRYSSETLTTPFINLTKFLINYYQLPPDR